MQWRELMGDLKRSGYDFFVVCGLWFVVCSEGRVLRFVE